MAQERLRLSDYSNIFVYEEEHEPKEITVLVPHRDGYITQISASTGELRRHIALGSQPRKNGFPDIVAPMVFLKNKLWVASYDLGLFSIELSTKKVRKQADITEIVQVATDGVNLFLASPDALYVSERGNFLKTDLSQIKTRASRAGNPFENFDQGRQRIFFGSPSQLLLDKDKIIVAYSMGSIGVFQKATGDPLQIIGNSVGFGSLAWASLSRIMAVTKRGLLMIWNIHPTM